MADFARDLVELLDHLEVWEPVAVCGLSMGGYIALALWKHWPQRVGRLLLADTRAIADTDEVRQIRQQQAAEVLATGIGIIVEGILPRLLHPDALTQRPELVAFLRQMMGRSSQAGVVAALRGMAARPDMTPELPNIRVPTLVLVGEADAISRPDEMRAIAQAIPSSQFVQIADAGHLTPLEQPAAFNASVQTFLSH
jgi:pimeloyl-ACP methyl ester carboxylesterase